MLVVYGCCRMLHKAKCVAVQSVCMLLTVVHVYMDVLHLLDNMLKKRCCDSCVGFIDIEFTFKKGQAVRYAVLLVVTV